MTRWKVTMRKATMRYDQCVSIQFPAPLAVAFSPFVGAPAAYAQTDWAVVKTFQIGGQAAGTISPRVLQFCVQ